MKVMLRKSHALPCVDSSRSARWLYTGNACGAKSTVIPVFASNSGRYSFR